MSSFVLGFGLSCHFLVKRDQGETKKYSDFRERKTSFGLNNQEVRRTRIPLIQY